MSMGGYEAVPERLSMFKRGRLIAAASALGALCIGSVSLGVPVASASPSSVAAKPVTGLLTADAAKGLGFPKTAQKPTGSSKTGQAGCPKGAEAAFEDKSAKTGVISEVLACSSTKVATGVLATLRNSNSKSTGQKPPSALGSTAFERATSQSTYAIVWQRGKLLSVVALDVNVPASSSSSTTTSPTPTPLTAGQQATLSNAALSQDKALQ
jgi:hypothetical protein